MDPIETILKVVAIPALVAAIIAVTGHRHSATGAVAVSIGAVAGITAMLGLPEIWPLEVTDRFGHLLGFGLLGALVSLSVGATHRWAVASVLGVAVGYALIGPLLAERYPGIKGWLILAGVAMAVAILSRSIERFGTQRERISTVPLLITTAAAALAAGLSGSVTLAQLGGSVTAALGGTWLLTLRSGRGWLKTLGPVLATALVGLLTLSTIYSSMGILTASALALSPLVCALIVSRVRSARAPWFAIAAAFMLAALALAQPLLSGQATASDTSDDDYGYE